MQLDWKKLFATATLIANLLVLSADPIYARPERIKLKQWEKIESERYGFMIAYPGSVFSPTQNGITENGHVLVSRDGNARLIVGAFDNESAATLSEYRKLILKENYNGAALDYAPVKRRSFIVSGTRGAMHFYERVSFTCAGRLINSWALLYPVNERHIYDRIVEAIAPTYSPRHRQKWPMRMTATISTQHKPKPLQVHPVEPSPASRHPPMCLDPDLRRGDIRFVEAVRSTVIVILAKARIQIRVRTTIRSHLRAHA